jgi:hypothetical protein
VAYDTRVPVPMRQCPPCERLSSESQLAAQSIPVSAHEPPERRPALQSGIRYECNIIFWVFLAPTKLVDGSQRQCARSHTTIGVSRLPVDKTLFCFKFRQGE